MTDNEHISAHEIRLKNVEREIFGNGQPGRLQRIEERLDKMSEKITQLVVTVGVIAGASGTAGGYALQVLFGGG